MLMKERYRTVTVCLSLLILALVFAVASDEELSRICIPLAFFAGRAYMEREGHMTGRQGKRPEAVFRVPLLCCFWRRLFSACCT